MPRRIHAPKEFFFYCGRNDEPIKLEKPEGVIEMTDERFAYLIAQQKEWRTEYLSSLKNKDS